MWIEKMTEMAKTYNLPELLKEFYVVSYYHGSTVLQGNLEDASIPKKEFNEFFNYTHATKNSIFYSSKKNGIDITLNLDVPKATENYGNIGKVLDKLFAKRG